jgi:hypothetical protein
MKNTLIDNAKELNKEINKAIEEFSKHGTELDEKGFIHGISSLSVLSDYKLKPIIVEYENKQKFFDVIIDILKVIIPINFTLLLTSFSLAMLKQASVGILFTFSFGIFALIFTIYKRRKVTEKYISLYKSTCDELMDQFKELLKKLERVNGVNNAILEWKQKKLLNMMKKQDENLDKINLDKK